MKLNGSKRRKQLIGVAFDLFASEGFRGTTTRMIAEQAGVSEATLYKYFPTKKDLFQAILDDRLCEISHRLIYWDEAESEPPRQFITNLLKRILREMYRDDGLSRFLMFAALENPDLWDLYVQNFIRKWEEEVLRYFNLLKKNGIIKASIPLELISMVFYGPVALLNDMRNLFNMPVPPEKELEQTATWLGSLLLDGILAKE
ncbi:MAG: TetR/AcrR family transcriptional regulator [Acidobacteria bacterium]|nr:TetR/AcrR family transcriptional regulator [Acidobacteriota bacterium]